ncbi:MAG: rod shape-determining protein RodA [Synergistaceae bacterium]|jgi:rod shape determining protein RodA|nr:rod shape-determining protein RodA [Synergistaceae bacterium]
MLLPEVGYGWGEIRAGLDRVMVILICALFALGVVSIYSAGKEVRSSTVVYVARQLVWGGVSAAVYVAILRVGYRNFVRLSFWMYAGTVLCLIVLGVRGIVSGVTVARWFQFGGVSFQPAELGKVTLILFMSRFCSRRPPENVKNFFAALAICGVSVLLILIQPDLGSALVYVAIIFAILTVAGTPMKYMAWLSGVALCAMPVLWKGMREYQRLRLIVFLDPYIDPQGAGYNVIQSRIAVGSGGLWGKGFLQGTQGRLHFLPAPHTDFIFSVFAEEFGFIGGIIVIVLFACLFWRILRGAFRTKDTGAKLLCVGVVAWLWFQVMESIAMSMGLAPITGIPMPLFSYGGSSLLMVAIALALAQSVAISPVKEKFAHI